MANESIKLNLIPSGEMPVFHCSQFDNGRPIIIELYNGEDAYELPSGYTAELHCRKVDNNIVTLASELVNTNVVTFISTTQLCACNGKNLCEVAIKDASDYLIGTLNFWLEVEMDPLKGGINSTSEIHDLYEQIEEITAEVIGDDYYDKTEVDNLLDDKADKSTTYTKTQVDTLLTSKADKSNVYTKSESDALLADKADADDVYTKAQVETKLAAKADAADVYTKDETDTLLDAKANANAVYSKVEVDGIVDDLEDAIALKANSSDVYTKIQVDNIILDIMPVDTAGPAAIASFDTDLAVNLVDVKTTLTPSLTGYTEAKITRCGVNLFKTTATSKSEVGVDWVVNDDGTVSVSGNATGYTSFDLGSSKINNAGVITISGIGTATNIAWSVIEIRDKNNNILLTITSGSGTPTFTADISNYPTADNIRISVKRNNNGAVSGVIKPQVEVGNQATEWHPYNGQTYTVSFGQTVYGGVLDVTRGKLHITHYYDEYDENAGWIVGAGTKYFAIFNQPASKSNTDLTQLCNIAEGGGGQYETYGKFRAQTNGAIAIGNKNPDETLHWADLTTFKADVALNHIQVCYELATPFDIDLTPVQIRALVGENNVFSDTGDTTVKYKEGIQHYIDKKVST